MAKYKGIDEAARHDAEVSREYDQITNGDVEEKNRNLDLPESDQMRSYGYDYRASPVSPEDIEAENKRLAEIYFRD